VRATATGSTFRRQDCLSALNDRYGNLPFRLPVFTAYASATAKLESVRRGERHNDNAAMEVRDRPGDTVFQEPEREDASRINLSNKLRSPSSSTPHADSDHSPRRIMALLEPHLIYIGASPNIAVSSARDGCECAARDEYSQLHDEVRSGAP
jgi:hypothetical protein